MRKSTFKGLSLSNERIEGSTIAVDFEALFDEYLDYIFNFCNLQLNDRALAEDITAEVFERAWKNRHTYDPAQGSVKKWLFQIARYRVIDEHRQRGRRPVIPLNEELVDSSQSSPEDQIERLELEEKIRQSMALLTDDEKTHIGLKFGAGLSNKEIARIVEKTEGAVASGLYRALGKLHSLWMKGEDSNE
jgi:RNA polymerase sigma-70 factor (ECF subfamily)